MGTRKYFGTDGIRGTANVEPMTAETALRVGMAAGRIFTRGPHRHAVVIGKDTRLSGYMLEPALTAGFISVGMDVLLVGPMPTPAVAMLTRSLRADLGVMISASHNPYQDNGIKLFGPDGYKLSDEVEASIETLMQELDAPEHQAVTLSSPTGLGRARRLDDAGGRYIESVKQTFPRGLRLDGLKVVVDCANGAAYRTAPSVLWELGAEVIPLGVDPNGVNINDQCGSQHPDSMQAAVISHGADIGIALDGDADRLVLCDEHGHLVDGDQILGLIARALRNRDELPGDTVVATVMSNLGLEAFLRSERIQLLRTAVGDRYVMEQMRASGLALGGEQSGHIILGDHATTGDGLVAALQVLAELVQSGRSASELLRVFQPYPQVLRNVRVAGRRQADHALASDTVKGCVGHWEKRLGVTGRVLLRKSGTEPLIRVMVEAEDAGLVEDVALDLCRAIESSADGGVS